MKIPLDKLPPHLIDLPATIHLIGNREDTLLLLNAFIDSIPNTKKEYDLAITSHDIQALCAICHRVKGTTAYFVLPELMKKLTALHELLCHKPNDKLAWLNTYHALIDTMNELYQLCRGKTLL